MKISHARAVLPGLKACTAAMEELVESGLTTASEGTLNTFAVTFQQAAKLKLLRLSSTLRNAHQELERFIRDDAVFSQSRLIFFLHRSWLLCRGLSDAIETKKQDQFDSLMRIPDSRPLAKTRVICLGVVKKVVPDQFCAFEFRLRDVDSHRRSVWSTVFPIKKGVKVPAEGYLHLPQKQKFEASVFLQSKIVELTELHASEAIDGSDRLQLSPGSTAQTAEAFTQWGSFLQWNPANFLARIQSHPISPFDVDIELNDEAIFCDYRIGDPTENADASRCVWPLHVGEAVIDVSVSSSAEGDAARAAIEALKSSIEQGAAPKPLFGLLYYSVGRLVFQPLSFFDKATERMNYLALSNDAIDKRVLLQALQF